MRYGITKNGKRIEAQKGIKTFCPICNEELVAKCGAQKINHWAHKSKSNCDKWYENKTQWHIDWQNQFPKEWQECVLHNKKTGEKHIADILTPNRCVVEFQHSYISEKERIEREKFYNRDGRSLIWVVDGNRLKSHFEKFKGIKFSSIKDKNFKNFILCEDGYWGDTTYIEIFPYYWTDSEVPIFFDFYLNDKNPLRKFLWCLFPERVNGKCVVMCISKENFVKQLSTGKPFLNKLKITQNKELVCSV